MGLSNGCVSRVADPSKPRASQLLSPLQRLRLDLSQMFNRDDVDQKGVEIIRKDSTVTQKFDHFFPQWKIGVSFLFCLLDMIFLNGNFE